MRSIKRWVTPLLEQDRRRRCRAASAPHPDGPWAWPRGAPLPLVSGAWPGSGRIAKRARRAPEQTCSLPPLCQPGGAAAGFDKNAVAAGVWQFYLASALRALGTVTLACPTGNPETTPGSGWRRSAPPLNRWGFNNDGAKR